MDLPNWNPFQNRLCQDERDPLEMSQKTEQWISPSIQRPAGLNAFSERQLLLRNQMAQMQILAFPEEINQLSGTGSDLIPEAPF
jgi:hypothetical protein